MAANTTSMMKEYLRKQLHYWIDAFKDEMLPRDFSSKSFSRQQLTLAKVPDKFLQEPLALQLGDLFLDVRRVDECDLEQRRDTERRAEAARFEPDPLGSIASMYAFATMINERLALSVDNVYMKVFVQSAGLQLHIELADVRARTTNALWQDMRNLSNCVDRSPDGLLRTRFKFISFVCSVQVLATGGFVAAASSASPTPLKLLHEHSVSIRLTQFGQRVSAVESWEVMSRVADVSLGALRFEHTAQQYVQIFNTFQAVYRWIVGSSTLNAESTDPRVGQHHHQTHRGPVGQVAGRSATSNADPSSVSQASFAWQITLRGSLETVVAFRSERLGRQSVSFTANQAIVNVIVSQGSAYELQLSLDALAIQFRNATIAKLTPERGVLLVKQLPSNQPGVLIQWRVKHIECRVEGDFALVLNEMYHSMNEKVLSETITCGTCHHKIRLGDIDSHVCGKQTTRSRVSSGGAPSGGLTRSSPPVSPCLSSSLRASVEPEDQPSLTSIHVRAVLHLEELEFYADSHLFHSVHELMKMNGSAYTVGQTIVVKASGIKLTTESTEFDGGAVFVPVLPLAFQMLECALQDCGCWQRWHGAEGLAKGNKTNRSSLLSSSTHQPSSWTAASCWRIPLLGLKVQYPDRCFFNMAHGSITTFNPRATMAASSTDAPFSISADDVELRSSFSDGSSICSSCHPQVSANVQVDRLRCQLNPRSVGFLWHELQRIYNDVGSSSSSPEEMLSTLFICVLQVRSLELTMRDEQIMQPAMVSKSLFKHAAVVVDNQLGHLTTQSTVDFRTLLATPSLLRFKHCETPPPRAEPVNLPEPENVAARNRELDRASACCRIQHFARIYCLNSRFRAVDRPSRSDTEQSHYEVSRDRGSSNEVRHASTAIKHCLADPATEEGRALSHRASNHESIPARAVLKESTRNDGEEPTMQHVASTSSTQHEAMANPQAEPLRPQAVPVPSHTVQSGAGKAVSSVGSALLSTAEDLVNPMKMVSGAANVFRGGFKMVKSTHQAIGTEVVQSLESAARIVNLPRIAMKSPFLSPFSSPTNATEVRAAVVTLDHQHGSTVDSREELNGNNAHYEVSNDGANTDNGEAAEYNDGHSDSIHDQDGEDEARRSSSFLRPDDMPHGDFARHLDVPDVKQNLGVGDCVDETARGNAGQSDLDADDCDELGGLSVKSIDDTCEHYSHDEENMHVEENDRLEHEPVKVGISNALLTSLPPVVRLLIQVDEHRLCIPINPQEKVGYLCREVVRRFNELFASDCSDDGDEDANASSESGLALSRVALHDRYGGIFSPSDLVGHLLLGSTIVQNDTQPLLFFAKPIDSETNSFQPPTRVALTGATHPDASALIGARMRRAEGRNVHRPVGDKFSRCSMLPLPLVVALLANESEGELLRSILTDNSCFARRGGGDSASVDADGSWPELALNVERLKQLLPVEVAWFGRCIEVTHIDAFVLCLQLLGLCSSRPTSRFVGRALRERLRIEASGMSPLVAAAWKRRQAGHDQSHDDQQKARLAKNASPSQEQGAHRHSVAHGEAETATPTFEAIKRLVQDRVGTYIRDSK